MACNGKWTLQGTDGDIQAYLAATGFQKDNVPQNVKDGLLTTGAGGYEVEYDCSGGSVSRKIYFKGEVKKESSAPCGEERDGETIDGRATKFTVEVQGNKIVRTDNCGGIEATTTFTAEGQNATTVLSCGGVSVTRKFTKA